MSPYIVDVFGCEKINVSHSKSFGWCSSWYQLRICL